MMATTTAAAGDVGCFVDDVLAVDATCGDVFDHIDDLLDFPKDDVPLTAPGAAVDAEAPPPPATEHQPVAGANSFLLAAPSYVQEPPAFMAGSGKAGHIDDLDMAQLEWLSTFFDDSNSPDEQLLIPNLSCPAPVKEAVVGAGDVADSGAGESLFRSSSPVSVLERTGGGFIIGHGGSAGRGAASSSSHSVASSSSSSSSATGSSSCTDKAPVPPLAGLAIPARARTKRPRPSQPLIAAPFVAPLVSDPDSTVDSSFDPPPPPPPAAKKKKKAKKAEDEEYNDEEEEHRAGELGTAITVRRCTHCQIEKTPQWRAGPMGPKTLCNACGVRYKSGRLFPEYRPAASPTFVPALHSNSHKKVVEMRLKTATAGDPTCDLLQFIRRRN